MTIDFEKDFQKGRFLTYNFILIIAIMPIDTGKTQNNG